MEIPEDLRYTSDHEWVRVDGKRCRVGITDYAQDALGDVVFLQLPSVGDTVEAGASVGEVESTKSVSEVYSPLNGTVVEVNAELVDNPQHTNSDPYGEGWMFTVEVEDEAALGELLDAAAYRNLVES